MGCRQIVAVLLSIAAIATSIESQAQAFPARPVRVIVTISGAGEVLIRLLGQKMSMGLGVPVIVEGQAAAGGAIGAETVKRAAPDGYTLLATTPGTHVLRQFLVRSSSFDPIVDFTPVTLAFDAVAAVGVHASLPVDSLQDLIDYAKRNPGKLSYGTSGIGTTHHMAAELLALATGIDFVHVPYKAGAQATQDALSGRLQVLFGVYAAMKPYAGKLKIIAITNDRRFAPAGDIPSIREVVPGFNSPPFWTAYYGPANLPHALTARLNAEIVKALQAEEVRDKLSAAGFMVVGSSPEELAATNRSDIERAGKIVRALGIQPE